MPEGKGFEIWTEKYRPASLEDVVNQKHVVERLKMWVKEKNVPNMLFAGPPGCGKTTAAVAVAREIFGPHWRENFSDTNASVTGDTPVMIKKNGKIMRTDFHYLAKKYFTSSNGQTRSITNDLEILTLNKDYSVGFSKVSYIFRHPVDVIINIRYEGGRINTSLGHSLMTFDNKGNIVPIKASQLKKGDFLVTFKTRLDGNSSLLDISKYKPSLINYWGGRWVRNPTVKIALDSINLNEDDVSWTLGMYLAEGCTSLRNNTQGQTIFTLGSNEVDKGQRLSTVLEGLVNHKMAVHKMTGKSGFNRSNESSMQYRIYNTQLTKFMRDNFYERGASKLNARSKRIPQFLFEAPIVARISFLNGYFDGDGSGKWEEVARIHSKSKKTLVDVAWLSRLSGLESSYFDTEARIIWKNPKFRYIKSDLLPAGLFEDLARKAGKTYELRHFLYEKKSRIEKKLAKKLLGLYKGKLTKKIANLIRLVNSDLSVVKITDIKRVRYNNYVYDVSIPGTQTFFGGYTPILLHNSDERGIDVVRGRVKNFARTKPIGADFRIMFLDEADALTPEAQQALRRTMEQFSSVCRFVLSCNYSSRIIEPIQSRTAVFRFRRLLKDDVAEYVRRIAHHEKFEVEKDAIDAIYDVSEGDLRRATNILQASAMHKKVTAKIVYEISSMVHPKEIREMIDLAIGKKFEDSRKKLHEMMINQGLAAEDIVRGIHREIYGLDVVEEGKLRLIDKLADTEFRINMGASPDIQLEAFLACCIGVSREK